MSHLAVNSQATHSTTNTVMLEDRVKRLVKPVRILTKGYRALSGETTEHLLAAFLSELGETILPRRIKVVTNTDQTAHLDVVNRRLVRVALLNGVAVSGGTNPADAATLGKQLQGIFAGATKAVLICDRIEIGYALSETGCTMPALAAAASLDLADPARLDAVERLFATVTNRTDAWITLDLAGNPQKHGGDAAWCRRLTTLARDGLADIDAQLIQSLTAPEQPGFVCLTSGGIDGVMLIYARSQNFGFLAALPADELSAIQTAWRTLI